MVVQKPLGRVRRESDPHPKDAPGRGKRIRKARFYAPRVYPGPVGEFLARELDSFESLAPTVGGDDALMWRVVEDITKRGEDADGRQGSGAEQ